MRDSFKVLLVVFLFTFSTPLGAQPDNVDRPVVRPTDAPVAVAPVLAPTSTDPKYHLRVSATYDGQSVKAISISRGAGPPRSYLSTRSGVVVLLKRGRQILNRTNLPDPLEVRVQTAHPTILRVDRTRTGISENSPVPNYPSHGVLRLKTAPLEIFLPQIEGADSIEFRAGRENGKLLGRGVVPNFQ
jgi:hypothetical protein